MLLIVVDEILLTGILTLLVSFLLPLQKFYIYYIFAKNWGASPQIPGVKETKITSVFMILPLQHHVNTKIDFYSKWLYLQQSQIGYNPNSHQKENGIFVQWGIFIQWNTT